MTDVQMKEGDVYEKVNDEFLYGKEIEKSCGIFWAFFALYIEKQGIDKV